MHIARTLFRLSFERAEHDWNILFIPAPVNLLVSSCGTVARAEQLPNISCIFVALPVSI